MGLIFGIERRDIAPFFEISSDVNWRKIAVVIGILAITPTALTHLFLWEVEQRLNLKIRRKPVFVALPGVFTLKQASLEWKQKLRVEAGTLSVRFPVTAIVRAHFPLALSGKNLSVKFDSELASAVGQQNVLFDSVRAELLVGGKSGFDINSLDAESKTIQFHLKGH